MSEDNDTVRGGARVCKHCGTHFKPLDKDSAFCCQGCAYVYQMLHDKAWGRFYDLKDRVSTPVGTSVFAERDWEWLEVMLQSAEEAAQASEQGVAELSLGIQGASCTACVWLVERVFEGEDGSVDVLMDVRQGQLQLRWMVGHFNVEHFANELNHLGYVLCRPDKASKASESKRLGMRVGLCAAFAMNTMLATLPSYLGMEPDFVIADTLMLVALLFATLSMLSGGLYFIRRAWSSLYHRTLHMDVPIALGLVAAYIGSLAGWMLGYERLVYFDFVSVFVLLMLFGRWLQEVVLEHNRSRFLDEYDLPEHVIRVDESGQCSEAPVASLESGWVVRVEPDALFPVAGVLLSGDAVLNMQYINGEQEARHVLAGERVPSGAVHCGNDAVEVRAEEDWADSLMSRLVAQQVRGTANKRLDRILRVYLIVVMLVALVGGVYWGLNAGIVDAMQVTISVLVVSCPCAIGVALPLLDELIVVMLRRGGIYVRSDQLWQRFRKLHWIAFDKTGTLTLERPVLQNPQVLEALDKESLAVLAAMVQRSLHPLARSLNQWMAVTRVSARSAQGLVLEEVPGSGLVAQVKGRRWTLGKAGWMSPGDEGDLVFSCDGEAIAVLYFEEQIRESSRGYLDLYQKYGYDIQLLSGDRKEKVMRIAQQMGLGEEACHWRQSPDEKAAWVRAHQEEGVLMVGDGMNDSLALDEASCSAVVVTDVNALGRKADVLLMGSTLGGVARLLQAVRIRHSGVAWLFAINVVYNLTVVSVALLGLMNPLIAAIVMPLSSVVSTLVALSLARSAGE